MKRMLYVTTVSGTINAFLVPHIKMAIDMGYKVDIATNVKAKINQELIDLGCEIYDIPFQRNPFSFSNFKSYKVLKKILNNNYNIVHTHTPIASMISRIASRGLDNIKVIYTAHGFHFHRGAPLKNWIIYYPLEKFFSRFTDVIITINSEDYDIAKRKFHSKNVVLVPGVGLEINKFTSLTSEENLKYRTKMKLKKDDIILSYIGELNNNKNQVSIINIMKNIIYSNPNYKLLLIGNGNQRIHLEQLILKYNLSNNVKLLGSRKDIRELLSITDLYIASSKREGLPVNVMEAMSMGKPIIANDNRGHRELLVDGINGYILNFDNELNVINKIIELTSNKLEIEKISKNNRDKSLKYEISKINKILQNIYINV